MSVTDKTAPGQTHAVTLEIELRHPPEKVWRALTDPVLISEWLLPVVEQKLPLARGGVFTLKTQPQPGWDGTVNCRVLDAEAPTRLRYQWAVGDLDTIVTFTLTPTPDGTLLSLVQSGFKPEQKQNFGGARWGLKMMSGKLEELLGRIP